MNSVMLLVICVPKPLSLTESAYRNLRESPAAAWQKGFCVYHFDINPVHLPTQG